MKKIVAIVAVLFLSSAVCAEPASRQTIERMLSASGSEAIIDSALAQIDGVMSQMLSGMNVPEEKRASIEQFSMRYKELVQEEISWEKLKGPMIDIYARVYTEEEAKATLDFLESPVGRKMVAKNPELMQASMELMQQNMMRLMPKLEALIQEMQAAN